MVEPAMRLVFCYGDDTLELRIHQFRVFGREYIQLRLFSRRDGTEEYQPSGSDITLPAKHLAYVTEGVRPNRPIDFRHRLLERFVITRRFDDVSDVAHLVRGWG